MTNVISLFVARLNQYGVMFVRREYGISGQYLSLEGHSVRIID